MFVGCPTALPRRSYATGQPMASSLVGLSASLLVRHSIHVFQVILSAHTTFHGRAALGAKLLVPLTNYEAEARGPKAALVEQMAQIFKVSHKAISVPEIDTYDGLMHTFFALEDMYGLKIAEIDGELCLHHDRTLNPDMNLSDLLEL